MLCRAELAGAMADTSPEWKKPTDIMKLRRRKTLCSQVTATRSTAVPRTRLSLDASQPGRKAQKRKNPFACLPSAEVTKDDAEVKDSTGGGQTNVNCTEAASCFIDVLVCCFCDMQTQACVEYCCCYFHYHHAFSEYY